MHVSDVFKEDIGLGSVVSLLWFNCRLPPWATKFIEMVPMLTAAVSGAMNRIVAARAGKDSISLTSRLLAIGSRFNGALDAATLFSNASCTGMTRREFMDSCSKVNKLWIPLRLISDFSCSATAVSPRRQGMNISRFVISLAFRTFDLPTKRRSVRSWTQLWLCQPPP
ncbi:hypothetical protein M378DRAFT_317913 [Amanita muscaria Koide BX008]|uniref:Uncharacterized protein n=1 Tax=Amanita muscaria (strain Koide BX008) TaxID=946122 RepID=A0A0C2WB07_AMAMK|nr:hypothetical protein M378DRAFT_317913 [Amanita muscaria Koide BX008]